MCINLKHKTSSMYMCRIKINYYNLAVSTERLLHVVLIEIIAEIALWIIQEKHGVN